MAFYFASDVHIRTDRPGRGARLARWVESLSGDDDLTIVGDLCDFWFSARERRGTSRPDAGLEALARFRDQGGRLTIIPGNHDAWLAPYYRDALGATLVETPSHDRLIHGLRVRFMHGHLLGARSRWKAAMEGRGFYQAFRSLPRPVASLLAGTLEQSNAVNEPEVHRRHLDLYGRYAASQAGEIDLVLYGHAHLQHEHAEGPVRWIVLGDWKQEGSYVRIDESGARYVVGFEPGPDPVVRPAARGVAQPSP